MLALTETVQPVQFINENPISITHDKKEDFSIGHSER